MLECLMSGSYVQSMLSITILKPNHSFAKGELTGGGFVLIGVEKLVGV